MQQVLPTENVLKFLLGGKACFTIKNEESGNRFTFKVKAAKTKGVKDKSVQFVSVLTGPNNETAYRFIGTIFQKTGEFRYGTKSSIGADAQSVQTFTWLWKTLAKGPRLPVKVKIYHEGRCGCCGRKLTVPSSILSGFGPFCGKS